MPRLVGRPSLVGEGNVRVAKTVGHITQVIAVSVTNFDSLAGLCDDPSLFVAYDKMLHGLSLEHER